MEKTRSFPRTKQVLPRGRMRGWVLLTGLALLAAFMAPGRESALAQGPPAAAERAGKYREGIEKAWVAHREFLEKGDWPKSQAELEKIYQWKLDQGIRNDYLLSLALLREQESAGRRGMRCTGRAPCRHTASPVRERPMRNRALYLQAARPATQAIPSGPALPSAQ